MFRAIAGYLYEKGNRFDEEERELFHRILQIESRIASGHKRVGVLKGYINHPYPPLLEWADKKTNYKETENA